VNPNTTGFIIKKLPYDPTANARVGVGGIANSDIVNSYG
jgi:hypothetical protein